MASLSITPPKVPDVAEVTASMVAPSPTGTESPGLSPVPMMRCRPAGPDPYAEDRKKAWEAARAGAPCPINQHGCMYFSASEWRFCPMCEWEGGHGSAEYEGLLAPFGGLVAHHHEDVVAGRTISISRAGLDTLFKAPDTKSFRGPLVDWHWQKLGPDAEGKVVLTRTQVHNLLMAYGSPNGCLTNDRWEALTAEWRPAVAGGE